MLINYCLRNDQSCWLPGSQGLKLSRPGMNALQVSDGQLGPPPAALGLGPCSCQACAQLLEVVHLPSTWPQQPQFGC